MPKLMSLTKKLNADKNLGLSRREVEAAYQARTVHRQHHMELQHSNVLEDLVKGTL